MRSESLSRPKPGGVPHSSRARRGSRPVTSHPRVRRGLRALLALLPLALGGWGVARAGDLEIRFKDAKGKPVEHAVVVAHGAKTGVGAEGAKSATIDQIDKSFVPHVVVVVPGTRVSFPNSDDIRHHVYSFSEAKTFELPLYKGMPAEPVAFDEPGVIVLGCNIHDFMRGYIYVADSPLFAVSARDGVAKIAELPAGTYRVSIWHPRLAGDRPPRTVEIGEAETAKLAVALDLEPDLRAPRAAGGRRRRY